MNNPKTRNYTNLKPCDAHGEVRCVPCTDRHERWMTPWYWRAIYPLATVLITVVGLVLLPFAWIAARFLKGMK